MVRLAVRFDEVCIGDTVDVGGVMSFKVINIGRSTFGKLLILEGEGAGIHFGLPDQPVFLVHRPWPEGKTERDMLREVQSAAIRLKGEMNDHPDQPVHDHVQKALAEMQEALDAYQLGRSSPSEKTAC